MIRRYVISYLFTLLIISGICSTLPFATRSKVRAGAEVEETWNADVTLNAPDGKFFIVDKDVKSALENGIAFVGTGPVRIDSAKVEITPKDVKWTESDTDHSAPGAGMVAHVKWEMPPDAPNGASSAIHIEFPVVSAMKGYQPDFRNGGFQKTGEKWVFREITAYRSSTALAFAQLGFALAPSIPLAALIVAGCSVIVLGLRERARKKLPDSSEASALPRIFLPSPWSEWIAWNATVLIFSFASALLAVFVIADGFMDPGLGWMIVIIEFVGIFIALIVLWYTRASLTTVQVDADTLSIAKGRGEPKWVTGRWADLRSAQTKSRTYHGSRTEWLEVIFPDGTTRRIYDPKARGVVAGLYAPFHPAG